MRPLSLSLLPLLLLTGVTSTLRAQAGVISGAVTVRAVGSPIAYARVHVPALGRELFADADGRFTIRGVPAGTHRVVARFVGYAPGEAVVRVESGAAVTVRIELARLPVRLAAVRVQALGSCRTPGRPDPADAVQLATVLEEMRENARRYRLLVDQFPFTYQMERAFTSTSHVGRQPTRRDTVEFEGDDGWRYAPGTLLLNGNRTMRLPDLGHFADSAFVATHCFAYAGLDTLGGRRVARVDFAPAAHIHTSDVRGWLAFDPETFRIRGTVFTLTNPQRADRTLEEVMVTTHFVDVAESLPVFQRVISTRRHDPRRVARAEPYLHREEQTLLEVTFRGARPTDR